MKFSRVLTFCLLALCLITSACGGGSTTTPPTPNRTLIQGADLSFSPEMQDQNILFYDQNQAKSPMQILHDHGSNLVRIKLWVNPTKPYNDLAHVATQAQQAHDLGMLWMLDFHFSDTWADPGNQTIPQAWQSMDYATMSATIEAYTQNVIHTLDQQGTPPDYVQIGNEISCGMLWPMANVCGANDTPAQWQKLAGLIAAANRGINAGAAQPAAIKRIIHLDSGGDNTKCRWFFDHLVAEQVSFDLIGLSYYPWWHGSLSALSQNLNDLASRYSKPVMVVETAYPWTLGYSDNLNNVVGSTNQLLAGYPATPAGQAAYLSALRQIVLEVPNARGAGVIYWAPDWLGNSGDGSSHENMAWFDFSGQALPAVDSWKNP